MILDSWIPIRYEEDWSMQEEKLKLDELDVKWDIVE